MKFMDGCLLGWSKNALPENKISLNDLNELFTLKNNKGIFSVIAEKVEANLFFVIWVGSEGLLLSRLILIELRTVMKLFKKRSVVSDRILAFSFLVKRQNVGAFTA